MPNLIAALDLGQTQDFSAYAVLEQADGPFPVYSVRHLERFDLHTPYPQIVDYVVGMHKRNQLRGTILAIDQTGVGRPVVDMFRAANVDANVKPITITGGNQWHQLPNGDYRVPKVDLVGVLQMLLPANRLLCAPHLGVRKDKSGTDITALLLQEMQDFRVKISKDAHEIYGAREGKNDDAVLSVSMAAWLGERVCLGPWDATPHPDAHSPFAKPPRGMFASEEIDEYGEAMMRAGNLGQRPADD